MKAIELDLQQNPLNERAKQKVIELQKEVLWYEQQIAAGLDPGVHTL